MKRILIVEDDQNLSWMIKENLEDYGYEVSHSPNAEEAILLVDKNLFDLLLIDVDLGVEMDGFDMAEEVRKKHKKLPIIFSTAKTSTEDFERGFSIGHVDYLKKPFGVRELSLRVNALLERECEDSEICMFGAILFNYMELTLSFKNKKKRLTKQEAFFLSILYENLGKVVSKEYFVKKMWEKFKDEPMCKDASLHELVYKLRKYMRMDSTVVLKNIKNCGYKLTITENK